MSRDKSEQAIEQRARDVIEDLREGIVGARTIRDVQDAATKAGRDRNTGRALGGSSPFSRPTSGRPFGL